MSYFRHDRERRRSGVLLPMMVWCAGRGVWEIADGQAPGDEPDDHEPAGVDSNGDSTDPEERQDATQRIAFAQCINTMEIRQVITAPRAPCQNPFAERVIGSIRRECLDHFTVLSETNHKPSPTRTPTA